MKPFEIPSFPVKVVALACAAAMCQSNALAEFTEYSNESYMLEGNQDNNSVEYGGNEGVYISSNGTWDNNATNADAHSYIKVLGTNTDGEGLLDMGSDTIRTYSTADTIITIDSDDNDIGAFFLRDGAVTLIDSEKTNTTISTSSGSSLDIGQTTVAITGADLTVTGATDLDSTLNVDGATTTAGITNTGALTQSGTTSITGTTTINTTGTSGTSIGNQSGTLTFSAINTTTSSAGNATINVDTDDGGAGAFIVTDYNGSNNTVTLISSDATSTTITADANGDGTLDGRLVVSASSSLTASNGSGLNVNSNGSITLLNELGATDSGLSISANGDTITLLNDVGIGGHGLTVGASSTTLTGGTNSSSLTLQDAAATLAVGTATSPETNAIVVTGTDVGGVTKTSVTIGGSDNTSTTLTANALTGTNNIEAKTNNMGVATAASINNIGNGATSTNTIAGVTSINTSINAATNINTGTSTGATTLGNALNTTNLNSAINNIGVSSAYATANNIGTNAAFSSINTLGNTNAASTVSAYGGAGYTTLNNTHSTMGTGTGGMVQTSASTATMRASSSGSLATNGTSGTMTVGAGGGYTTYATTQNTGTGTTIGGVVDNKDYTNKINGSLFVDGNVYINGTLDYVSSNSANTTVVGSGTGTSILPNATQGTLGGTAIVMKDSTGLQTQVDANGRLTNVNGTATESTVAMTLTNGYGEVHGMVVTEYQTTISGGTRSSSLTLNDNGATFSNSATGAPVQVHGVADGTADFDAINVRQLGGAIASVSAMANIPQVDENKTFSVGAGYGNYMGKSALALGGTYRIRENAVIKASLASGLNSGKKTTIGVGAAFSW